VEEKMSNPNHASLISATIVKLRKLLHDEQQFDEAQKLLLQTHAWLHAQGVSPDQDWSYQDEVLVGASEAWMRIIPEGEDHSIAWLLWHLTRCEDITMNLLVAETDQELFHGNWFEKLNITWCDTGNAMTAAEIQDFSQKINLPVLFGYRMNVGKQTQAVISRVSREDLHRKVKPSGIQRIYLEGAVVEEAREIAEYWSKRDVAGLFLMPATRHILSHLNEALRIKKKIKKTL
jgi:hypothetical protein